MFECKSNIASVCSAPGGCYKFWSTLLVHSSASILAYSNVNAPVLINVTNLSYEQ